ncbi:RES family NAD+ phosphorylase [Azoarcus sp. PA01]|nr:RES family NAD+ phosphorylase [Azoarcus sp. PA01]KON82501.1 RES family NAD+ phosphorylase [Azoarcus sp. PA01]
MAEEIFESDICQEEPNNPQGLPAAPIRDPFLLPALLHDNCRDQGYNVICLCVLGEPVPPSDQEIRNKYRLPDSVPIRHELPNPQELAETSSFLLRTAQAFGYEEWMWRSVGGMLIGVAVIVPAIDGVIQYWAPKIDAAYEYAAPYLDAVAQSGVRLSEDLIAFGGSPGSTTEERGRLVLAPYDGSSFGPSASAWLTVGKAVFWRIVPTRHLARPFQGPLSHDTFWLPQGTPVALAAEHLLQAILEGFIAPSFHDQVHARDWTRHVLLRASLDSVKVRVATSVEAGAHGGIHKLAHRWFSETESALLLVPSRSLSDSRTVIINLQHPDARRIAIEKVSLRPSA